MKTIWKFPFEVDDSFEILMPRKARVLSVQMQGETPCIWALVDDTEPLERRLFQVRGTGHNAEHVGYYIGSFQMMQGDLVFHLFSEKPVLKGGDMPKTL